MLGILKPACSLTPPVASIVALYHAAMAEAEKTLLDGANQRPQYSLRTLCRALAYVASAIGSYGLERALWDGFHMTFVTQLQQRHQPLCESLMLTHLLPKRAGALAKPPPMKRALDAKRWQALGAVWRPRIQADPRGEPHDDARYIVTATVEARLQTVARMVAARRFPVLLQGPTSAGKTSMVERLARAQPPARAHQQPRAHGRAGVHWLLPAGQLGQARVLRRRAHAGSAPRLLDCTRRAQPRTLRGEALACYSPTSHSLPLHAHTPTRVPNRRQRAATAARRYERVMILQISAPEFAL